MYENEKNIAKGMALAPGWTTGMKEFKEFLLRYNEKSGPSMKALQDERNPTLLEIPLKPPLNNL